MDYGAQEIIVHFLKRTTSVSFVQVLTVTEDGTHRFGPDHLKIVEQTYLRSPSDLPQVLQHSLRALPDMLARPETTPINARSGKHDGNSFYGGLMLSGSSIKISARKRFGGFSESCAPTTLLKRPRSARSSFGEFFRKNVARRPFALRDSA
jgi:hypothetical protein